MTYTPWGEAQHIKKIITGVSIVSTAGHGGLRISRTHLNLFTEFTRSQATRIDDKYAWFEEDCAWALPAFELGLKTLGDPFSIICNWFPQYYNQSEDFRIALSIHPESETLLKRRSDRIEESELSEKREKMKKENSPELICSAISISNEEDLFRRLCIKTEPSDLSKNEELKTKYPKLTDAILKRLVANFGNLVAVWTADEMSHFVVGYKNRGVINLLKDCEEVIFSVDVAGF
jgi:hypothetical protein